MLVMRSVIFTRMIPKPARSVVGRAKSLLEILILGPYLSGLPSEADAIHSVGVSDAGKLIPALSVAGGQYSLSK